MSLKLYLLFIQLPVLIWTCGSDVGGTSSTTAEFGISFFAPLAYTYPPPDTDMFPGQSLTLEQANNRVNTDLNLAIGKALSANQIYLYIPPTLNFTFVPPSIQIVDGTQCETDNTYIALSGTVIYKCSTAVTTKAVSGATNVPGSTVSAGSTSSPESTTSGPGSSTTAPEDDIEEIEENFIVKRQRRRAISLPRRRAVSSDIKAYPFTQSMTVTATASQPLFENQWKQIARSVQQALEDKKLLFNDEIQVTLL